MLVCLSHKFNFRIVLILIVFTSIHVACNTSLETDNSSSNTETPLPTEAMALATSTTVVDHLPPTAMPTVEWTPALEKLQANILGNACTSPCFFGIEPGVTRADSVSSILSQLKKEGFVEDFYLRHHPSSGASYIFLFSIGSGGSIGIDESSNIVTSVGFGLSIKFLTLGDVIDNYGEPKLVAYGRGNSFEGLYLAYPDQEIFLWVRTDLFGDQLVSSEMTVITLSYLSQGAPNSELEQPHIVWIDWEGYKEIYYYYRKLESSR